MEIDFASIGQQATAMASAEGATGATTASVDPITPQSTPQAAPAAATAPPATPAITDPATPGQPAERTYDVDLGNGKVEKLTESQLREAYNSGLRQADFTRKTQEVARQRQEAEAVMAQLQQRQQQIDSLLNNPQALLALAQQQQQAQQPQQPIDPNAPVTVGQLQSVMAHLQTIQKQTLEEAQSIANNAIQTAQYSETINQTLSELYKEYPVLKAHPEMEDVMRFRVWQMGLQTPEEALTAFRTVAKELNDGFENAYKSRLQQAATARANLTAQGIEAPGGVAPQPTQPNFLTKGKREVDWSKLAASALGVS